jgi:spermidine/putrescine-binding protein
LILLVEPPILPQAVLDSFSRASGIAVLQRPLASVEAALRAGEPADLALLPTEALAGLIEDRLLRPIDPAQVQNAQHLPPSLRDLVFDPGNRHALPLRYGLIGLILRPDAVERIPSSWAEALDPAGRDRVAAYARPREIIAAALLAEGRAAEAEDPQALTIALDRLLALGPERLRILPPDAEGFRLLQHRIAGTLIGRSTDLAAGRAAGLDLSFVLPAEGGLLWVEHMALPASGQRPELAERLMDHLLRPDVALALARLQPVALANEAAQAQLDAEMLADTVAWPSARMLARSHMVTPLSPAGRALQAAIWEQLQAVLDGGPR